MDATLEDDGMTIRFDALKRADELQSWATTTTSPCCTSTGKRLAGGRRSCSPCTGWLLPVFKGLRPAVGLVASGLEARLMKVRLDAKLYGLRGRAGSG